MDSIPIRRAPAKRSSRARVAPNWANKGYCASQGEYDYGVKVHLLALHHPGTLPSPASEPDWIAFRQIHTFANNLIIRVDYYKNS